MDNNINSMDYIDTAPITSSNSVSLLDGIKSISITTWLIIILIFSFLGFNVFVYLAQGTQDITNFLGPLFKKILGILGLATKEVIDITAEGTRTIFDGTANFVDETTTAIQNAVDKPFEEAIAKKKQQGGSSTNVKSSSATSSVPSSSTQIQQPPKDIMQNNTLNKALNTAAASNTGNQEYQADDSTSSIQQGGSKSGWCYIGEDRGFRTCAQVGVNDTCMSGDIFPSQEICINPNLRP
jgi:hypothetical protein